MKKQLAIFILITAAFLAASETAGYAGAFLRYGLDARSESLGRAVTADTRSAYSLFFNPASASHVTERQVLCGMKILSMDRKFAYLSYVHPINRGATVSGGILYTGTGDIEGRDKYGDQFATYSYNENLFYLNFGLRPKEFLSIGVTAKLIWARFPELDHSEETVSSLTFAYDIGAIAVLPKYTDLSFGLSARNVKGKNSWDSSDVWSDGSSSYDYFPVSWSAGAAWNPSFNRELSFYADINSIDLKDYGHGFGLEWIKKFENNNSSIAFRAGTVSGWLSLGFGYEFVISSKKMIVDYAYTHEDISVWDPHTVSWRFYF
ncbi:MAG: hypothetical protein PHH55_00595 [Candidatus Delongbacteria bacterium]|nr:hypothetical protein [Candidatus Delongbacteria bacterium]